MPAISPATRQARLPAEATSFVGRRGDLAAITRLLSQAPVVTLTGPGGVGKTRLALRVAAARQRAFTGGAWLIELADLERPELLAHTVVEVMRIADRSRPPDDALLSYARDRRILLVLDNCEHLVGECAALAAALARRCPGVRILATSREPLGIAAERVYAVPPLPLPTSALGGRVAASVALFAARAQATAPGFTLAADRAAVERICVHLDGMPLAIELAARQLGASTLGELEARLADLLTGGCGAVGRHATLRAVMDWSWDLCSSAERLVWARFAATAGHLDLPSAEAICSGDGIAPGEVVHLLRRLVDTSILTCTRGRRGVHYRMLGAIRAYGLERLAASGRLDRWRARHRDYYRDLAAASAAEMFSAGQDDAVSRLQHIAANLRLALETSFAATDGAEQGLAMAADLFVLWIGGPQLAEGRHWLARGLAAVTWPCPARAHALWVAGWLAVVATDVTAAAGMLEEARTLGAALGLPAVRGYAALCEGMIAMYHDDDATAIARYEEALAHHRGGGEPMGVALALIWVCLARSLRGESPRAVKAGAASLALCEAHGDGWIRAYALMALGVEMTRRGRLDRAGELTRLSLAVHHRIDDRLGVEFCVGVLAWIAADQRRFGRAATLTGVLATLRLAGVMPPEYARVLRHFEDPQARVLAALGRRRFEAAEARGAALAYEAAVAYALEAEPPGSGEAPGGRAARLGPLTPRESDVARLVARGLTDREIAGALWVARRTAESHVGRILTKLGFGSRRQITAWVRDQELRDDQRLLHVAVPPPRAAQHVLRVVVPALIRVVRDLDAVDRRRGVDRDGVPARQAPAGDHPAADR